MGPEQACICTGLGAVSPGGWGVAALRAAGGGARAEPPVPPGDRHVPAAPTEVSAALPDARRMAGVSRFAFAAGLEAFLASGRRSPPGGKSADVSLLLTTTHGAAHQTVEFAETLLREGPSRVSPMLFSTSVLNAPASHLTQGLGLTGSCTTVVAGEEGWERLLRLVPVLLAEPGVTAVLAVAAAELEPVVEEVYRRSGRTGPFGEGAAAALFERAVPDSSATLLPAPVFSGDRVSEDMLRRVRERFGEAFAVTEAWGWILEGGPHAPEHGVH
ncbi:MAG: beta-ketoacyl synthase chain length factor [Planctomycetes bacterium]|nr:beta-ketoacyl synthase chain length factor [Planctomycetota bacterium]